MSLETTVRNVPPPILEDARKKKVVNTPPLRPVESRERDTRVTLVATTEASLEHPDRNEDSFYHSAEQGVFMVADGMGGVPAGDVASRVATQQLSRESMAQAIAAAKPEERQQAELIKNVFEAPRDKVQDKKAVEQAMAGMLLRMNDAVEHVASTDPLVREKVLAAFEEQLGAYDETDERSRRFFESLQQGVATTASLAKMWRGSDGKDRITLGQVGDSRIYRLRKGNLKQLTTDDSQVNVLIEEGMKDKDGLPITDDQDVNRLIPRADLFALAQKRKELQPIVLKYMRSDEPYIRLGDIRATVTQGVGLKHMMMKQLKTELKPHVTTEDLEDGDLLLAVSDGITDNLLDAEIETVLIQHQENPLAAIVELDKLAAKRALKGKPQEGEQLDPEERKKRSRAKKDDRTGLAMVYHRKQ